MSIGIKKSLLDKLEATFLRLHQMGLFLTYLELQASIFLKLSRILLPKL